MKNSTRCKLTEAGSVKANKGTGMTILERIRLVLNIF